MFGFLGFGRSRRVKHEEPKPKAIPQIVSAKSWRNEKQCEMIRLALNNVLCRQGIASQWLACELLPMPRPGAADLMLTQFVIFQWREGLIRYAPRLQDELFDEIHSFDSSVLASDFLFVWKFALESETAPVKPAAQAVKFDLPKSALDRDDDEDCVDDGFAATVVTGH
ncbi:MAG: hypothetical protein ACOYNZ_00065 [Rhodoferax sp.]